MRLHSAVTVNHWVGGSIPSRGAMYTKSPAAMWGFFICPVQKREDAQSGIPGWVTKWHVIPGSWRNQLNLTPLILETGSIHSRIISASYGVFSISSRPFNQ